MKNLRKIIGLFVLIFVAGIAITVFSINTTLNKKSPEKTVEVKQDRIDSLKTKKRFIKGTSYSGTSSFH